MATVDDRSLALGRLYARAILDVAEEQGQADALLEEMAELTRLLERSPDLRDFFESPLVDDEARAQTLEKAFRGRASDLLVDSLQVINAKARLGNLPAIAEGYRLELRDRRGLVDAHVRTAVPLTEELRTRLAGAVAGFTGRQPTLIEKVDPSLIGGMVVEVAGNKIDTSIASRLKDLGAALERRASQEILRGGAYTAERAE